MSTLAEAPADAFGRVEELYRSYRGDVYRSLLRDLRNHADAEDATQLVFLSAYRALERGGEPRIPRAWLLTIARNTAHRWRRARVARLEVELPAEQPGHGERTPVDVRDLWDALGTLPHAQRAAFVLHEAAGLSYDEVADRVGISHAAVESAVFRARRTLQSKLTVDGDSLTHDQAVRALPRLAAAKLTRAERESVEAHLHRCARCAAELERLRSGRRRLPRALALLPFPELPRRIAALLGLQGGSGAAAKVAAVAGVVAVGVGGAGGSAPPHSGAAVQPAVAGLLRPVAGTGLGSAPEGGRRPRPATARSSDARALPPAPAAPRRRGAEARVPAPVAHTAAGPAAPAASQPAGASGSGEPDAGAPDPPVPARPPAGEGVVAGTAETATAAVGTVAQTAETVAATGAGALDAGAAALADLTSSAPALPLVDGAPPSPAAAVPAVDLPGGQPPPLADLLG